jgi:hypothetical protein
VAQAQGEGRKGRSQDTPHPQDLQRAGSACTASSVPHCFPRWLLEQECDDQAGQSRGGSDEEDDLEARVLNEGRAHW